MSSHFCIHQATMIRLELQDNYAYHLDTADEPIGACARNGNIHRQLLKLL